MESPRLLQKYIKKKDKSEDFFLDDSFFNRILVFLRADRDTLRNYAAGEMGIPEEGEGYRVNE